MHRRTLLIATAAAPIVGCERLKRQDQTSRLDQSLTGYASAIRWGSSEVRNTSSRVEHEASTAKIDEDQIFYCRQRGLSTEDAINMTLAVEGSRACRE